MYFDRKKFKKDRRHCRQSLSEWLQADWLYEFLISPGDGPHFNNRPPAGAFGRSCRHLREWRQHHIHSLGDLLWLSLWFGWISLVVGYEVCGIIFKSAVWLIVAVVWMIVATADNLKFGTPSRHHHP